MEEVVREEVGVYKNYVLVDVVVVVVVFLSKSVVESSKLKSFVGVEEEEVEEQLATSAQIADNSPDYTWQLALILLKLTDPSFHNMQQRNHQQCLRYNPY